MQENLESNEIVETEPLETTQETQEAPKEEPKQEREGLPKGVEKRFAKMTAEKHALRNELAELKARFEEQSRPKAPELTKEDFGDDQEAYFNHLAEQKAEEKLRAFQEEQKKAYQMQEAQNYKNQSWQKKVETFSKDLPDYVETLNRAEVSLDPQTVESIMESDIGPLLAYELAKDPELAERLNSQPNQRAVDRFLTKLEIKLENQPTKQTVSTTPPPTPKATGNAGGQKDPSKMSMSDWMEWRQSQVYK